MASTAALELLIKLNGANQAGKELDNLGKKGGGLGDVFKTGLAVAGGAILGLGAALAGAAASAAEEQVGMARLNTTLKNSIPNWDGNTDAVEAYISKQQQLAFSDDELRDSLSHLVGQTGDLAEAQELQAMAMDLARAKGIKLEAATKAVGKVDQESIGILKKLGIQVTDQMTKEQALTAIREATAGQAEAYAQTAAGSMERVQNALGDAFETIGGGVLDIVSGPLQAFADWVTSPEVQTGIQQVANFIKEGLGRAFEFIGQVISVVGPPIQGFFGMVGDALNVFKSTGDPFQALGGFVENLFTTIGEALPVIISTLGGWAKAFFDWIGPMIPGILGALAGFALQVIGWIGEQVPGIVAKLLEWGGAFLSWIWNDVLPKIPGELGKIAAGIWEWITTTAGEIGPKLLVWATNFWTWITDVEKGMPAEAGKIATALWNWITKTAGEIGPHIVVWVTAFWTWAVDVVKNAPTELGKIVTAVWKWVTDTKDGLPAQIVTWVTAFWSWVTAEDGVVATAGAQLLKIETALWNWITGVDDQLPTKLHTLATRFGEMPEDAVKQLDQPTGLPAINLAIGKWIAETTVDIGTKVVTEWVPAFFLFISGPGSILHQIPIELKKIWDKFALEFSIAATAIGTAVQKIGAAFVNGIIVGIKNEWGALTRVLQEKINSLPQFVKDMLGIKSPSTVFADQVGAPIAEGIGVGFFTKWPGVSAEILAGLGHVTTNAQMWVVGATASLTKVGSDVVGAIKQGWMTGAPTLVQQVIAGLSNTVTEMDVWFMQNQPGIMTVGNEMAGAIKSGWDAMFPAFRQQMIDDFQALLAAITEMRQRLAEGVSVGTTTVYNGSGGVPAGAGSGGPMGGGTPGGSRGVMGSTGIGGSAGGISIGTIIIHAGSGASGRQLATDFIEGIEHELGMAIATRSPDVRVIR